MNVSLPLLTPLLDEYEKKEKCGLFVPSSNATLASESLAAITDSSNERESTSLPFQS